MDVSDVGGGDQSFCTEVSHLLKLQQTGLSFSTTAGL